MSDDRVQRLEDRLREVEIAVAETKAEAKQAASSAGRAHTAVKDQEKDFAELKTKFDELAGALKGGKWLAGGGLTAVGAMVYWLWRIGITMQGGD